VSAVPVLQLRSVSIVGSKLLPLEKLIVSSLSHVILLVIEEFFFIRFEDHISLISFPLN
jgi:hypothetical protein